MKTSSLHLRIEPELREALEKIADEEGRTLSNLITYILTKYIGGKK